MTSIEDNSEPRRSRSGWFSAATMFAAGLIVGCLFMGGFFSSSKAVAKDEPRITIPRN
jgi:hypothetical protein